MSLNINEAHTLAQDIWDYDRIKSVYSIDEQPGVWYVRLNNHDHRTHRINADGGVYCHEECAQRWLELTLEKSLKVFASSKAP